MRKEPIPLIKKYSPKWWRNQISQAEDRRKKFIESAEESIRVYNAQKQAGILNDVERRINVWWYCINTLLPAYYSSTPKAEVNLRKRAGGISYELGSVILERNTQYAMDVHFDFDKVGYQAALQFLLTGQAVLWARYVPTFKKVVEEFALIRDPSGMLIDGEGKPYEGSVEGATEALGAVFINQEVEKKVDEKAVLEIVQYSDYFCSDARSEAEIEWHARRAYLDRAQTEEMFGSEVAKDLSYDALPDVIKRDIVRDQDRDKYEGKAELYEIWCKATNRVYWLHKNSEKIIIESSEPPIKFEKFYPCSVISQSVDPDSVIPCSDYIHVRDQILEVERLTSRIHAVTQAIRTNALYDATMGAQVEQLMQGDLKLTPIPNWPSYKQRGGISQSVEFMNIEPYVNALNTLQGARQQALQQLYETLKVSDLLRGTSEQYKSATANRLENAWSSMGLVVRQNQFSKFISDAISNLGTIIAEMFDEERILDVGDADRLIGEVTFSPSAQQPPPQGEEMPMGGEPQEEPQGMPEMSEGMEARIPGNPEAQIEQMEAEIIDILRDKEKRCYRIQIASDSMVAVDQAQQQQEGAALIQTAGQFFDQMRGLVDQYPPLLSFSIALFQNMIKRFKGGKELDGIFTKAFQQIGEIAKAKEEAAKQPPPPDPVMQETQARMQIAQIESQARMQVTQMEMQDKAMKNQLAYQDQQLKMQRDQLDAQLAIQKQQFEEFMRQQELGISQQEVQVKANSVQVDMLKVQAMSETDANKQAIQQEANRMANILELQKLEIENMRIRLQESEKLLEERRLNSEQELERIRLAMDKIQTTASQPQSQAGPTIIQVDKPKRKKTATIVSDESGNPIGIQIAEEPKTRKLLTNESGDFIGMELNDDG